MKKDISKISILKKIFLIPMQTIFVLLIRTNIYASELSQIYSSPSGSGSSKIEKVFSNTLWVIMAVGMTSGITMVAVIGVKYIWESPEGKADLKKRSVPYLIGAFLLLSGGLFVDIVINAAAKLNN